MPCSGGKYFKSLQEKDTIRKFSPNWGQQNAGASSEVKAQDNKDKGPKTLKHANTQSVHNMKNSSLEENLMADPGIEPGTFYSVGNGFTL